MHASGSAHAAFGARLTFSAAGPQNSPSERKRSSDTRKSQPSPGETAPMFFLSRSANSAPRSARNFVWAADSESSSAWEDLGGDGSKHNRIKTRKNLIVSRRQKTARHLKMGRAFFNSYFIPLPQILTHP